MRFLSRCVLSLSIALGPSALPAQDRPSVEDLFFTCAESAAPAADRAERELLDRPGDAWEVLRRHLVEDDEPGRRALAARLLGRLGEEALPALPALLRALRDPEESVVRAAFHALADVAPWATDEDTRDAVAHAVVATKHGPDELEWLDRKTAMRPYFRLRVDPRAEVEELRALLSPSTKPYELEYACILLERRGEAARPAVPELLATLEAEKLRNNANLSYSGAGLEVDVRARVDLEREIRRGAAEAILAASPESRAAARAWRHLLQAEYGGRPDEQRRAVMALGRLGSKAGPALPALIELLGAPAPEVRWEAATALGMMGPAAAPAVDALRVAAAGDDPQLSERAAASLRRIETGG